MFYPISFTVIETVRLIFDIMDFTGKENIPGLMIFIDFRKAFDIRSGAFLFNCLDSFNLDKYFL